MCVFFIVWLRSCVFIYTSLLKSVIDRCYLAISVFPHFMVLCNSIYNLQYYTAQLNNPYQLEKKTHKNKQYFTFSRSRRESHLAVASWQSSDTSYSSMAGGIQQLCRGGAGAKHSCLTVSFADFNRLQ